MAFFRRTGSTAKTIRADAARSADIDDYADSEIEADGPGFALAVVARGTVVHAAGYGLADLPAACRLRRTRFSPGELRQAVYRLGRSAACRGG